MSNLKTFYKGLGTVLTIAASSFALNSAFADTQTTNYSNVQLLKTTAVEGVDYTVLSNPKSTEPSVYMVMNYVCPHCEQFTIQFHIPQILGDYISSHYKTGKFVEYHYDDDTPEASNPYASLARLNAVLYVTHNTQLIPKAYSIAKDYFQSKFDTKVVKNFITNNLHISASQTDSLWNSLSVNVFVKKQIQFAKQYNISQTPTFIINGKYELNLSQVGKELNNYIKTLNNNQITSDQVGVFIASKIIAILDKTK